MLSRFSCVQHFVTPWTVAYQAPLSMGFSRIEPMSFMSPALAGRFFITSATWEAKSRTVVQSLSHVQLFVTPWTAAHQASLSFTISWSLFKLMSIESVMPSNHLILCYLLLLLPSIFPSNRVFSKEPALHIRWPKYWSFHFSISSSNEYSGLISFRMDWLDRGPQAVIFNHFCIWLLWCLAS